MASPSSPHSPAQRRNNPFTRAGSIAGNPRPLSAVFSSPPAAAAAAAPTMVTTAMSSPTPSSPHSRNHSLAGSVSRPSITGGSSGGGGGSLIGRAPPRSDSKTGGPSPPPQPLHQPPPSSIINSSSFNYNSIRSSSTFAPSFIKSEELARRGGVAGGSISGAGGISGAGAAAAGISGGGSGPTPRDGEPDPDPGPDRDVVAGIEGENDFSGKRYVWLKDPDVAFVKGWVVEELPAGRIRVECDDGTQRDVDVESVDKVNPAKFDKANDMAELTHLNEASVVHNLHTRYQSDLIYTYSGLFLVTVNPYRPLPIYTAAHVDMYRGRSREDVPRPHIFAMADQAFRNLVGEGENQSILVTGESGAGKTENTKKVIQYLAAVAADKLPPQQDRVPAQPSLAQQILRANPILEAFGNAQTVRNNNSSRFGKFIRIGFSRTGTISGAFIDWYLLEKSRVVRINSHERNYHIFYQLLRGADPALRAALLLDRLAVADFAYTRGGHDTIAGVSDSDEWAALLEALAVVGITDPDRAAILRTVAAVLHLGNLSVAVAQESRATDQARLAPEGRDCAARVCHLLAVPLEPFLRGLLRPRVRAGREWVERVQTPEQVRLGIDALAKGIYERGFGDLVGRINRRLAGGGGPASGSTAPNSMAPLVGPGPDGASPFIGVLDIAGFEIFEENSFEQLCINYTNEKLQQFFNHHMFVLEQDEYAREQIEWQFIDFGRDLQPTIDLIELPNPIGIFSCLDEDCVMPRATDKSFTEKLDGLWGDRKSTKYRPSRPGRQGFILTHYAAEVEYSTRGWLEKNKDPLNDNVTRLLAHSADPHVAGLFFDCADGGEECGDDGAAGRSTAITTTNNTTSRVVKKGLFRTVAQRHKEQLHSLMAQLHSTHPHFVRCILPNHAKKPRQFDGHLVLDQLRCNGVLEGIRIARTGFPNRLSFAEFRQRYEVLCRGGMGMGMGGGRVGDDRAAAARMLDGLVGLDKSMFRVGRTKVFFRAGVLAELEEQRDALITDIMTRFQAAARGRAQRRLAFKRLFRAEAARIVQRSARAYLELSESPWWQLLVRTRPLLGSSGAAQAAAQAAAAKAAQAAQAAAQAAAEEVRKRDAAIRQLQERAQTDSEARLRLEEERRGCQAELARARQTLDSERALALDKEEIFNRLQLREAELEEKLAGALEDQERLEDQLDSLLDAKKAAEADASRVRAQLEQAASLVARLEEEKGGVAARLAEAEAELSETTQRQSERGERETALEDEVRVLQSQLSLRDRKARELEGRLLQSEGDRDGRLAAAQRDLQTAKTREQALSREGRELQQQLAQLSRTSTDYEDLIRRKESELTLLRSDAQTGESERRALEDRTATLAADRDRATSRLAEAQAELAALGSRHAQLQREAEDARHLLDARLSEDAQEDQNRQLLEAQLRDLRDQLAQAQSDLSRERQSRDDVLLLGEHKFQSLRGEFDRLNEAKIIIEKELYAQQDTLRRNMEARATAERERDEARDEIRRLRAAKTEAEESRLQAEAAGERAAARAARERETGLRRDLDAAQDRLAWFEAEVGKLNSQIEELNKLMLASGEFGLRNDQDKDRLERELATVRSRLAASENDNRALLNKLQQKGLEMARSASRAGEAARGQVLTLQRDKARAEEQTGQLRRQLGEAQVSMQSLEKRIEKLNLTVEDLNHEVAREAKAGRGAEKVATQLAETGRSLDGERQLRSQAQATARSLQGTLESRDRELRELRAQMLRVLRTVDPDAADAREAEEQAAAESLAQADGAAGGDGLLGQTFDLVRRLEEMQQNLRVQTAARASAEAQLVELRARPPPPDSYNHNHSIGTDSETLAASSARYNGRSARPRTRKSSASPTSTPRRGTGRGQHDDSDNDDHDDDDDDDDETRTAAAPTTSTLKARVAELQTHLELAQMQNRHLQSQLLEQGGGSPSSPPSSSSPSSSSPSRPDGGAASPSLLRVRKLEQANSRLHEMLDDSAKKLSALEKTVRTGELSLNDVQARSHEEILDVLNNQEESRRALLRSHKDAVAELADTKAHFDRARHDRARLEVDLRDCRAELQDTARAREQEAASRNQLLQDRADLQIRLDTEAAKLADLTASLALYRGRADEYFGRLEQAEMAVLKARRTEEFARQQAREAEESHAEMLAERDRTEALAEELQQQTRRLEERLEDVSTDLEAATQAKRRLQHELEDYRSQRAQDMEDQESSLEQTRRKYQAEFATLSKELDLAREERLFKQGEMARLREELDELRSKWDDEVLNSSTWSKEKSRLEATLSDVAASRDEAARAHAEAQARVVTLLSQARALRAAADEAAADRDRLAREKRGAEARLEEALAGLDELARGGAGGQGSPSSSDDDSPESDAVAAAAAAAQAQAARELLELRASLARQEDVAAAAAEKMRRAEALVAEVQREALAERDATAQLQKDKAAVEKALSEMQVRVVDLETKGYPSSSASQDMKFLNRRIQELESELEGRDDERARSQRSARNVDRALKELRGQVDRREKQNAQMQEDSARMRDKVEKLLKTIDELQASESANQLAARRAERELREEREKSLRLERELEGGWGSAMSGSVRSRAGMAWQRSGSAVPEGGSDEGGGASNAAAIEVPTRKSSLRRVPSTTKGFL